jgi:hypothetical protein
MPRPKSGCRFEGNDSILFSLEMHIMKTFYPALGRLVLAGLAISAGACNNESLDPSASSSGSPEAALAAQNNLSTLAATLRVTCERRTSRSKISVDANNVTPRGGRFRARVRAAGGTVTSALKRAIGDEVEFDFDSNTERGATRIPANFIRHRAGADVVGQLINANGVVVASRGVECSFR